MNGKIKLEHSDGLKKYLVIALIIFLVASLAVVGTRLTFQDNTKASLDQSIDFIERQCIANKALAKQYKIRGEKEEVLAESALLQTTVAIELIEETLESDAQQRAITQFRSIIPRLEGVVKEIVILPLPNCQKQAELLRQELPK